jgi:hypothetical protein
MSRLEAIARQWRHAALDLADHNMTMEDYLKQCDQLRARLTIREFARVLAIMSPGNPTSANLKRAEKLIRQKQHDTTALHAVYGLVAFLIAHPDVRSIEFPGGLALTMMAPRFAATHSGDVR